MSSSSDSQERLAHNHCSPWSEVNLEFAMGIISLPNMGDF